MPKISTSRFSKGSIESLPFQRSSKESMLFLMQTME